MTYKPLVKICGITDKKTFAFLVKKGVDLAGFIFYPASPRYVPYAKARSMLGRAGKSRTKTVGVFVNEDPVIVKKTAKDLKLDYVQVHGGENDAYIRSLKGLKIIRAVPVKEGFSPEDLKRSFLPGVCHVLLDTSSEKKFGGTGRAFHWTQYPFIRNFPRIFISGGLDENNMLEAVRLFRPSGLDFNSGAEIRPGVKSRRKIKRILKILKAGVDHEQKILR